MLAATSMGSSSAFDSQTRQDAALRFRTGIMKRRCVLRVSTYTVRTSVVESSFTISDSPSSATASGFVRAILARVAFCQFRQFGLLVDEDEHGATVRERVVRLVRAGRASIFACRSDDDRVPVVRDRACRCERITAAREA